MSKKLARKSHSPGLSVGGKTTRLTVPNTPSAYMVGGALLFTVGALWAVSNASKR